MLDSFFEHQVFQKLNNFEVVKLGSGFIDSDVVQKHLDDWTSRVKDIIGEPEQPQKQKSRSKNFMSQSETKTATGKKEDIELDLMSGKAFEYLMKNGF